MIEARSTIPQTAGRPEQGRKILWTDTLIQIIREDRGCPVVQTKRCLGSSSGTSRRGESTRRIRGVVSPCVLPILEQFATAVDAVAEIKAATWVSKVVLNSPA